VRTTRWSLPFLAMAVLLAGCSHTTKCFSTSGVPYEPALLGEGVDPSKVQVLETCPEGAEVKGYVHSHWSYAPFFTRLFVGWKSGMVDDLKVLATRMGANAIARVHGDAVVPWWHLWRILAPGESNYHAVAIVVCAPPPSPPLAVRKDGGKKRGTLVPVGTYPKQSDP
jgi:hypothetical protein